MNDHWHRLHPLSPFIRTMHIVAVAVVVAAQQIDEVFNAPFVALAFVGVGATIAASYGWASYHWTGFRATTAQIELKTGVLFRQHRRIPTDRIEAIDVARPLTARLFGLVELRVEVASGAGSEMRFQYLDQEDATALREYVLQLQPASTNAVRAPTPDLAADTSRVMLEVPASHVVMAYGIGPLGLVAVFALFFGLIGTVTTSAVTTTAAITSLPIMLAIAITTFRTVESYWGFRVSHDERGMVVRRGFLNELTQKVPVGRIQGIRMEEPFLWRAFGRARLSVDVAGYRNVNVNGTAETVVLAPVAARKAVHILLQDLIGTLDIDALEHVIVPKAARWRAPVASRFLSIAGNETWAIAREGVFRRRTDIVAHAKAQSIRVTQGPWQRKLQLATLHIDTAGNRIHFRALHRAAQDAYELAWLSRKLGHTSH